MRTTSVGHVAFAATLIVFGILGLTHGDFAAIWQDAPKDVPLRHALAYLCAAVSLGTGIGLLIRRTCAGAARVLLAFLLLWMLLVKGRYIVLAPTTEGSYQSWGETAVLVAGAWALYVRFATAWDERRLAFATGDSGLRIARILYALALIAFGLSHFVYLQLTAPLVPSWLPWHDGWAYFTGATYLAAGAALLVGVCMGLAAMLSALQMGLFTLLVWMPIAVSGQMTPSQWSELGVSWALTAAGWVLAESIRSAGRRSGLSGV
jgi:uncharacterized membrane protein